MHDLHFRFYDLCMIATDTHSPYCWEDQCNAKICYTKIIQKLSRPDDSANFTTVLRPSHYLQNMYNTETALFIGGGGSTKLCVYIFRCGIFVSAIPRQQTMWGGGMGCRHTIAAEYFTTEFKMEFIYALSLFIYFSGRPLMSLYSG